VGRTLRIELWRDEKLEGKLTNTSHNGITLEIKAKEKKGKPEVKEIAFEEIREAYVVVEFGKKGK
jgi:hypothetical protein